MKLTLKVGPHRPGSWLGKEGLMEGGGQRDKEPTTRTLPPPQVFRGPRVHWGLCLRR